MSASRSRQLPTRGPGGRRDDAAARIFNVNGSITAAREAARQDSGQFGEQPKVDPGVSVLDAGSSETLSRFTDDDGITWIYGSPVDPRPAAAAAAAEAARITGAGEVAFVRSDPLGDEVEFEVRAFSNPFDAWAFAEQQGYTQSQQNPDGTVDLHDPDSPRSCRLTFPAYR